MLCGAKWTDPETAYIWAVSNLCIEYSLSPSQARHELENDPDRMMERIMRLRSFARTKEQYDAYCRNPNSVQMPTGPDAELVKEFDFAPFHKTEPGDDDE